MPALSPVPSIPLSGLSIAALVFAAPAPLPLSLPLL